MSDKPGVHVSLNVEKIEPLGFAEIPFTVENNTSDVLVLDSFLIRADREWPGSLVILKKPLWQQRVHGTQRNPRAPGWTDLHTAFVMPGQKLTSCIEVKVLFTPAYKKEIAQRFVGRLTYNRVSPEEFERRVVKSDKRDSETVGRIILKNRKPSIRELATPRRLGFDYWPGGGIPGSAFTKKMVSLAPSPFVNPYDILAVPLNVHPEWVGKRTGQIYWCVYSVALKTWAFKYPGGCTAIPYGSIDQRELPLNTDLAIFDYADACALSGMGEIPCGYLAGESIGGDSPDLDRLDLGIEHSADYNGRKFSVKIKDLIDSLAKIGKSPDYAKVEYIGVNPYPWHPYLPLTPSDDWSDLWQKRDMRHKWKDPAFQPVAFPEKEMKAIKEHWWEDFERYMERIQELVRQAQDRVKAGLPQADVWAETQDRIIDVIVEYSSIDYVKVGHREDICEIAHKCLPDIKEQLWKAAEALGVDREKVDWGRLEKEMNRVLEPPQKVEVVEDIPPEVKARLESDIQSLKEEFDKMVGSGRQRINEGFVPEAIWAETEDRMRELIDNLSAKYRLSSHWESHYFDQLRKRKAEVANLWS